MITREQLVNIDAIAKEAVNTMHPPKQYTASVNGQHFPEPFELCGFAWVNVHGIRKQEDKAPLQAFGFKRNEYEKAQQLWVSGYEQSAARKEAYAQAFAAELRTLGFKAYAGSRLD